MNLELQNIPIQTMAAVVVSATTKHLIIRLPEWSERLLIYIEKDKDLWPSGAVTAPSVNTFYMCDVDLNAEIPVIRKWKSHPESGSMKLPSPIPAPSGLPSPPDRLPIFDAPALARVISVLGTLTKAQREGIAYLIRRAHGQGCQREKLSCRN